MFLCKMTSYSGTRKFILNTPSHGLEFFVPVWSCERKNFQSRHSKYVYTVKSTVILYKKDCFFFAGYYRFFKSFFIYFFPGEKPRNYQESNFACNSISISRILDTSDLSWRQEMGLWSPAYNTFRIIDNIR